MAKWVIEITEKVVEIEGQNIDCYKVTTKNEDTSVETMTVASNIQACGSLVVKLLANSIEP